MTVLPWLEWSCHSRGLREYNPPSHIVDAVLSFFFFTHQMYWINSASAGCSQVVRPIFPQFLQMWLINQSIYGIPYFPHGIHLIRLNFSASIQFIVIAFCAVRIHFKPGDLRQEPSVHTFQSKVYLTPKQTEFLVPSRKRIHFPLKLGSTPKRLRSPASYWLLLGKMSGRPSVCTGSTVASMCAIQNANEINMP